MTRPRGLTLIEMLIVVVVLAMLAAVIVPQFSRATPDSQLAALKTRLLDVRAQLRLYRSQHDNQFPSLSEFAAQMTRYSNACGQTATAASESFELGPYLRSVPANPYTGENRIGKGPAGTSDWFYEERTGLFRANHDAAFFDD